MGKVLGNILFHGVSIDDAAHHHRYLKYLGGLTIRVILTGRAPYLIKCFWVVSATQTPG